MEDINNTFIPKDVSDFAIETDDFSVSCISKVPKQKSMPPVLIENILHQGHSMLLCGPAKSYKSYLLLMLCIGIATGTEWLGNKCSQGNVLLIEFENSEIMTHNRIKSILEENGLDESCLSHISILSIKNTFNMDKLTDWLIKNIPQDLYSAIIIDPLYKIFEGAESQAEFVDKVLSKIDYLSKKLKASIIMCHHTKKETQGYQSPIDKISGSSIIGRDIAALICISAVYEKDGYSHELIKTKLRHFPPQEPFYINISGGTYSIEKKKNTPKTNTASEESANISKSAESKNKKDLIRFYKFLNETIGTVKINQLEELMGVSKNTLKKYIDETPGFSRDNGVVTYTAP